MMKKEGLKVNGHRGTWYVIGEKEYAGRMVYLLEHETYGDEAASIIVDAELNVLLDDVYNGFDDYDYLLESQEEDTTEAKEHDYSALVKNCLNTTDWHFIERKIEQNFRDGEADGDSVNVYIVELLGGHYGSHMGSEFCSWFGIKHNEEEGFTEAVIWDYDKLQEAYAEYLNEHKPQDMKGSFYLGTHEADGSLCLWYTIEKEEKPFSVWRREEGYKSWDAHYNDELVEGREYEDIREEYDGIIEEYEKACEDNHWKECKDEE